MDSGHSHNEVLVSCARHGLPIDVVEEKEGERSKRRVLSWKGIQAAHSVVQQWAKQGTPVDLAITSPEDVPYQTASILRGNARLVEAAELSSFGTDAGAAIIIAEAYDALQHASLSSYFLHFSDQENQEEEGGKLDRALLSYAETAVRVIQQTIERQRKPLKHLLIVGHEIELQMVAALLLRWQGTKPEDAQLFHRIFNTPLEEGGIISGFLRPFGEPFDGEPNDEQFSSLSPVFA